tara:strand:- start:263 stop:1015 length:753 start_codon:yes stop_codon:yes gene_type:complete
MKKIILTLIFILPLTTIFAQDNTKQVWRVWYMTAKDGKVKQLEKGLADHTEKFHPTDGWPEYFFDVISGPNAGSLMGFSGPHNWKSFDERVRSQGDVDHFNKFILPYVDNKNSSIDFWVYLPDVSYNPATWKMAHLSYNYTVPGTNGEYLEFLEAMMKVKKANKSDVSHEIYKVVTGENPDTWIWAYPMEKMEDIESSAGAGLGAQSAMRKVLGKQEADRLNKIYQKVIKSRMREIVKFRPDLSTRAESN